MKGEFAYNALGISTLMPVEVYIGMYVTEQDWYMYHMISSAG